MKQEEKTQNGINNYFYAPVGKIINNYGSMTLNEQGCRQEQAPEEKRTLSDEKLADAILACQPYFWAQSSYAVVYCVLRDDFGWDGNCAAFERMVELLPFKGKREWNCPEGTINSAFHYNPNLVRPVNKWTVEDSKERVLKLVGKLREELNR